MRHPFVAMILCIVLTLALAAGGPKLRVDSGIEIFFADDDPFLLAEKNLKATYGVEDNILLVIDAGEEGVFHPRVLAAVAGITEAAWQMPSSRRVDSITNFLHASVQGDDIVIAPLVEDTATLDSAAADRIRAIAMAEPALVGRLVGESERVTGVNVTLLLPETDKAAAIAEAVNYARQLAAEAMDTHPALDVKLAGWAVTEQTLADVTAADATTLIPLLFALVLVVLALLLRSLWAAVCAVLVIGLSVAAGMGFAGWIGINLNSVNVSAPTIILTLAIADTIHLLTPFLRRLRQTRDKRGALQYALQTTIRPIVLTSVTTALGFLSMTFSESPPFGELGIIAAVGVLAALAVTVLVLPACLLLMPFGDVRPGRAPAAPGLPMTALAGFVTEHYRVLFWIFLLIIAAALSALTRIELNDDPAGYFSDDVPVSEATALIERDLSGTQTLYYSLQAAGPGGITEPEFLANADKFAAWLREQPEVVNVALFTDTLKRLNQVMHEDDPAWHKLPDSREMAAQYTLLYEISIPYGQDVTHQISADKSQMKVAATLTNQQSQGLLAFDRTAREWLQREMPHLDTAGAGQSISFANVGLRNIQSMITGSLVAVLLISGCLIFAFRSLRYGLISFIPNLFPALVTLGIWGAAVGEVNIAASVVFSLTLGIIVDDTTHFLVHYMRAREQEGLGAPEAVQQTFETVGSALVTTSIVLALGFLALVFSDFSVNATSGLLVAITIVVAIVLDLLFLPSILLGVDRYFGKQPPSSTGP